eukprot:5882945-Prymnesium_polylepis.1
MACLCCRQQWGQPLAAGALHVGLQIAERFGDVGEPLEGALVQRRVADEVLGVDVAAALGDEDPDRLPSAVARRQVDRGRAIACVRKRHGGTRLDQKPDALGAGHGKGGPVQRARSGPVVHRPKLLCQGVL